MQTLLFDSCNEPTTKLINAGWIHGAQIYNSQLLWVIWIPKRRVCNMEEMTIDSAWLVCIPLPSATHNHLLWCFRSIIIQDIAPSCILDFNSIVRPQAILSMPGPLNSSWIDWGGRLNSVVTLEYCDSGRKFKLSASNYIKTLWNLRLFWSKIHLITMHIDCRSKHLINLCLWIW